MVRKHYPVRSVCTVRSACVRVTSTSVTFIFPPLRGSHLTSLRKNSFVEISKYLMPGCCIQFPIPTPSATSLPSANYWLRKFIDVPFGNKIGFTSIFSTEEGAVSSYLSVALLRIKTIKNPSICSSCGRVSDNLSCDSKTCGAVKPFKDHALNPWIFKILATSVGGWLHLPYWLQFVCSEDFFVLFH